MSWTRQGPLFHGIPVAKVLMKLICHSTKWMLDPFYSCIWLLTYFPTTFVGRANTTSFPTTFVGTAIPTKLVGMLCFDKSCSGHGGGRGRDNWTHHASLISKKEDD